jgi:excisionase family DNA binding protein
VLLGCDPMNGHDRHFESTATRIAVIQCRTKDIDIHTAFLFDDRCCIAYHSTMTNDETNNPQQQPDPLTIGELITLQEAAEYSGLQKDSLHDYIKRGRLKAKKIGRFWVTTRAAVDGYLQSRRFENIPKKHRKSP